MTSTLNALTGSEPTSRAVLRSTLTSPFGRKVRMAAEVLDLADTIDIQPADTLDAEDDLRLQNPLGKMPCLLVDDTVLYDSRVILEYLDMLGGGGRLCPKGGIDRFVCLTRSCLADGVADAALLIVYEGRFRDESQKSDRWLDHQHGKLARGLGDLSDNPPDPTHTDLVSISLACALGYLDWRKPVDWRARWPQLVEWLDAFAASEPAFNNTEPPK
ncbi:glutathione S-transferase family protein [Hoeflea sp. CAU 1731]